MEDLFIILITFFIHAFIIFCIFKQCIKRQIIHNDKCISRQELKLSKPFDQNPINVQLPTIDISYNEIPNKSCSFPAANSRTISMNISNISTMPSKEIVKINNQIIPSIDRRELICYTDGSYSPFMQIGHSGFRGSDGSSTVHCYTPRCPRNGSTESEVDAVSLAIQYAARNYYNTLIIRTDNSKVEQLLCRPKIKDNYEYPIFCQILNKYRQQNKNNIIRVERVRGHTRRHEQTHCEIKREFAKIDRLVRKKNRQYIRQQRIEYEQFYLYCVSI